MFAGLYYFAVLAKIRGRWEYGKRKGKVEGRHVIDSETLDRNEVREEYEGEECERQRIWDDSW